MVFVQAAHFCLGVVPVVQLSAVACVPQAAGCYLVDLVLCLCKRTVSYWTDGHAYKTTRIRVLPR